MADKIKFKVHTEATKHRLDLMMKSARGKGLESVLAFLAAQLQQDSKRSFLETADPSTDYQRQWDERYKESEYDHPILRKTGNLWADVIADFVINGSKGMAFVYVPPGAPSHAYASKHQFGEESHLMDSIGELPARPFAGITTKSRRRVAAHAMGPNGLLGDRK